MQQSNAAVSHDATDSPSQRLEGKYLTFKLGGEVYGVGILAVREIIEPLDITPVPKTDFAVKGVINLRGRVIPLVDLKMRFEMGEVEFSDQTVIIVIKAEGQQTVGVLVDEVLEVVHFKAESVSPPPQFDEQQRYLDFLVGTGKIEKTIVFLLDLADVITPGGSSALF